MSNRFFIIRGLILMLLFGASLVVWFPTISFSQTDEQLLTVRFLDVGQGDAIHVITVDGYEMLIDGGSSSAVLREFAEGRSFFDKKIDVMIATHPDTDHVAGLVDVLKRYQVDVIFETGTESDSLAAIAFDDEALAEGARIVSAQAGQVIQLGASTTVRILSPQGDTTNWKSNSASVIIQVKYGDIEFMLTGDAPSSIEEYLVGTYGSLLESEVLKLGHHGSKTSSSEIFLKTVSPEYAVVSAGKDNRYGHPHVDVINRADKEGSEITSTAESGTIIFKSDGKRVWVD